MATKIIFPFKTIQLRNGLQILVDTEDYKKVKNLRFQTIIVGIGEGKKIFAKNSNGEFLHQIIIGKKSKSFIIKWKNKNPLDCRKDNMILISKKKSSK